MKVGRRENTVSIRRGRKGEALIGFPTEGGSAANRAVLRVLQSLQAIWGKLE
jgi:hypothetical protein